MLLLAAPLTRAGTISFGELDFTFPALEIGGSSFVSIPSGTIAGQYTIGADLFCDNCTADVPTTSVLRLSNVQIVCTTSGGCGPIDLEFQAQFGSGTGDVLLLTPELSGSGDSASGFAQICVADSQHICSSNGSGSQSVSIPFSGLIDGSDAANFSLINGFSIFGDFHLDGLPQDSTGVSLTNSFSISLAAASTVKSSPPPEFDTPEPAAMFPFLAAIVLMFRASRSLGAGTQNQ